MRNWYTHRRFVHKVLLLLLLLFGLLLTLIRIIVIRVETITVTIGIKRLDRRTLSEHRSVCFRWKWDSMRYDKVTLHNVGKKLLTHNEGLSGLTGVLMASERNISQRPFCYHSRPKCDFFNLPNSVLRIGEKCHCTTTWKKRIISSCSG